MKRCDSPPENSTQFKQMSMAKFQNKETNSKAQRWWIPLDVPSLSCQLQAFSDCKASRTNLRYDLHHQSLQSTTVLTLNEHCGAELFWPNSVTKVLATPVPGAKNSAASFTKPGFIYTFTAKPSSFWEKSPPGNLLTKTLACYKWDLEMKRWHVDCQLLGLTLPASRTVNVPSKSKSTARIADRSRLEGLASSLQHTLSISVWFFMDSDIISKL